MVQLKTFTSKPSIFRSMVGEVSPDARQGDVVSAYDKQGSFIGYGFWNAGAPIALRILILSPPAHLLVVEPLSLFPTRDTP
jgi:23S rRNA (cytosine1962-C5)-methyltransferase